MLICQNVVIVLACRLNQAYILDVVLKRWDRLNDKADGKDMACPKHGEG